MNKKNEIVNKLCIDALIKSSRVDYLINEILNANNGPIEFDQEIKPSDFNNFINKIVGAINDLEQIATDFIKKYVEAINEQKQKTSNVEPNGATSKAA